MTDVVTRVFRREVGSLPGDVTSFVGRRHATAQVKRALSESRLVTLTGAGGVGKTRLARHVACGVQRAFVDGVWLVDLADLDVESLVAHAVAKALGLSDTSARESEAVLVDFLADKRLLLVLDNCEHMLDACARLIRKLLPAAPGCRVLATSRESLGIAGEQVWPVVPLSVPSEQASLAGGVAHGYESLILFEDRAAAAVPGFTITKDNEQAVARICQRLDGLPLAIELAAAQVRVLSVEQILARLENRFRMLAVGNHAALPRHQTLRAAVKWSFDLCSELERTLWARLSVFADGFALEAAEAVCASDGLAADDVFTALAGLVDKSILIRGENGSPARYRMLETIRQYGREQLTESGDTVDLRRRHRDYYLRLSEQAEADWFGPNQPEWLNRFRADELNLWAALKFCLTEPGEARTGLHMVGALWWHWIDCARAGRHWVDQALALDTEPSRERAKALWVDAWIALNQGDAAHAMPMLDECAALARELGDEAALAYATQWIGRAKTLQNLLPDALMFLEQALDRHRAVGELNSVTTLVLYQLAWAADLLGDTERAVALLAECIAICETHGERWTRSWALWKLSVIRWRQGDLREAKTNARKALQLKRTLHDQFGLSFCIELLAWIATTDNDAERAALLFGMSETLGEPIGGAPLFGSVRLLDLRDQGKARAREVLGERAFDVAFQRGGQLTVDAAAAAALGEELRSPPESTAEPSLPQLTQREREVAELVAQGQSNKEIAASLVVSQRTAESHVERILSKLGFASRTQIAVWIAEQQEKSRYSRS